MQALAQHPILLAAPVQATVTQQHLLERLHYVSSFSEQVIFLHGPSGAGKSTLLELYLEQASDYAEVAFINAAPNGKKLSDAHLRTQILTQLYGTISVSNHSLAEQLQRQRKIQHAIVVIDDADQLTSPFIAELTAAITALQSANNGCRLSVVLAGASSWAKLYNDQHQGLQKPLLLAIEPLTQQEQFQFVRAMLPPALQPSWTQQRHQRELAMLSGYPGEIQRHLHQHLRPQAMDLGDGVGRLPAMDTQNDDGVAVALNAHTAKLQQGKRSAGVPWLKIILLTLLIMLTAVIALNWQQVETLWSESQTPASTNTDTTEVTPAAPEANITEDTQAPAEESPVASEADAELEPLSNDEPLPTELAISFNDALNDLNGAAAVDVTPGELNLGLIRERSAPAATAQAPEQAPEQTTTLSDMPRDNAWLLAQPSSNYTIQVNRLSSTEWLESFLAQANMGEQGKVVVLQNAGNPVYVSIYGSYSSADAARSQLSQLPPQVQQLQPFIKPIQSLQQEIR